MAYEKQQWKDGEEGGTPLSADRLNHIEQGIADADKDLSEYAKESDLGDLAKKNENDLNLSQFAKSTDLADLAKESDLQSLISRVEALENPE